VRVYDFVADPKKGLAHADGGGRVEPAVSGDRYGKVLSSDDVIETLADLSEERRVPGYVRSDNPWEVCSKAVRGWL